MTGRRLPSFALLLTVLLLPACDDDGGGTAPELPVFAGTYVLETFDGQPLPAEVNDSISLVADTILVQPSGDRGFVRWRTYLDWEGLRFPRFISVSSRQSGDSVFLSPVLSSRIVARGRVTDDGVSFRTIGPPPAEISVDSHPLGAHDWVHRRID